MSFSNRLNDMMVNALSVGGHDSSVAAGRKEGWEIVQKFGGGIVQTTERTIWDNMAAADYPYKYTNSVMTGVSDDPLDTGQTIRVNYIELDGSDWVYKKGVMVTDGTTPVTIQEANDNWVSLETDANIMFPFRIINIGTGQGTGSMIGTFDVKTGATIYGQINNGFNQSLMAIFPVASGHSAFIHSIGRSVIGAAKATTFTYAAIPFGQVRQAKRVAGLSSNSEYEVFDLPYFFPEKTILEVRCKIDVSTAQVNAWFDLFVVENEKLLGDDI